MVYITPRFVEKPGRIADTAGAQARAALREVLESLEESEIFSSMPLSLRALGAALDARDFGVDVDAVLEREMIGEAIARRGTRPARRQRPSEIKHYVLPRDAQAFAQVAGKIERSRLRRPSHLIDLFKYHPLALYSSRVVGELVDVLVDPRVPERTVRRVLKAMRDGARKKLMTPKQAEKLRKARRLRKRVDDLAAESNSRTAATRRAATEFGVSIAMAGKLVSWARAMEAKALKPFSRRKRTA